jgi:hypothetical protein
MDEKVAFDDTKEQHRAVHQHPSDYAVVYLRMRVDAMVENDRERGDATDPVETAKSTRRQDWRLATHGANIQCGSPNR